MTSPGYKLLYQQLGKTIDRAIYVSRKHAGIISLTGSHFYASSLFTLLTTRSLSLRKLLPKIKPKPMLDSHWDFGSVCTLTRTILETRLAFYYLGYEACHEDEWMCRWAIFCLHDEASRKKMLAGIEPQSFTREEQAEYDGNMRQHRSKLQLNQFFATLPSGEQRSYLDGKRAYMQPLEDIAERCGIPKEQFRIFYTFMSQQVHALPVAYFRMDEGNRGRGIHSDLEDEYHQMCMSLIVELLEGASNEMELKFAAGAV